MLSSCVSRAALVVAIQHRLACTADGIAKLVITGVAAVTSGLTVAASGAAPLDGAVPPLVPPRRASVTETLHPGDG